MCRESIISIHSVYDNLFHHDQANQSCVHVGLEEKEPQSFTNDQRNIFHRLANLQRILIEHAALEPVLWCINNGFSAKLYNMLAQQQINTYRMLHSIDGA
ncbi:unnamed protein product, partial [Rotaria socialis]